MIGKRLKVARVNAGLTQYQLGVSAGLTKESASARISQYEKEIHSPEFGLVCSLADRLNLPAAYFYATDDDLATLIVQYHHFRLKNPGMVFLITPSER